MRTLCDVCEGAAAIFFCAADEAALCLACDEKVHLCNKLASRHIRVGLAAPSEVPKCDICENAPGGWFCIRTCKIDGSSLCLQCDMVVHVGGKRTHRRYLLLRQRAEFPGDKPTRVEDTSSQQADRGDGRREPNQPQNTIMEDREQNHLASVVPAVDGNAVGDVDMDSNMIDLNARPQRTIGQSQNHPGMEFVPRANGDSATLMESLKSEAER